MIKKFQVLLAVLLVMTGLVAVAETDYYEYTPRNAAGLVYLDVESFYQSRFVEDLRRNNLDVEALFQSFEKDLEASNINPAQAISKVLLGFNYDGASVGLIQTAVPEEELQKDLVDGSNLSVREVGGRTVYDFTAEGSAQPEFALTYVRPDLLMAADVEQFEEALAGLGKVRGREKEVVDTLREITEGQLMALVFKAPSGATKDRYPELAEQMENISMILLTAKLEGENDDVLVIRTQLDCFDAKSAQMIYEQQSTGIALLTGIFFNSAPDLQQQVTDAIKIKRESNFVKIDLKLSMDLISNVGSYIEYQLEQGESADLMGAISGAGLDAGVEEEDMSAPVDSSEEDVSLDDLLQGM